MHCLWITLGVVGVRDIAVSYIQTDQKAESSEIREVERQGLRPGNGASRALIFITACLQTHWPWPVRPSINIY